MSRNFKLILWGTFSIAILLIVFLQFNANRSLDKLISANEDLLQVVTFKTDLQQLQTNLVALDNKVRGTIIKGTPIDSNHIEAEINTINSSMARLQEFEPQQLMAPAIDQLDSLIAEKISYDINVLDTFNLTSKPAAEKLTYTKYSTALSEHIRSVSREIEQLHGRAVTTLLKEANSNGRQAGIMGSFLAIIATLAALFILGYVLYKVRQQHTLIGKLDIAEKKAREAARIKENFLANMSHEIRTPLNAIIGYTQLLQKDLLDPKQELFVSTIHQSSQNLLTIVNDILDLSSIEVGMLRMEYASCDLKILVRNVVNTFRQATLQKNISLLVDIDPGLPDLVHTDGLRLTQVLVNLVSNAIKFTNEGGVTIKITNQKIKETEVEVHIAVSDTGIGISKEFLPYIFDRFQQGEHNNARYFGGTGLGLAIVKDLVQLLNGTIKVQSDAGRGTEFLITLYLQISTAKKSVALPGPEFDRECDFKCFNILVAEDNAINQDLIKHILGQWNVDVHIVGNGIQVLEKLATENFQLILMDIQMPGMDGYSCTKTIRNKLQSGIPIVAMTAHAMPGERDKCIAAGMNDYLAKPIQEDELKKMLRKFILPVDIENSSANKDVQQNYKIIDLRYLQEVSAGNSGYEKLVTGKFLQMVPSALTKIEHAWKQGDAGSIHKIAHNMKTTISIMGLNHKLDEYLTFLENYLPGNKAFDQYFSSVKSICEAAIAEAEQYYLSI